MRYAIWKFAVEIKKGVQTVELPHSFQFLSMQVQGDRICMWGWVQEPLGESFTKQYEVIGTGWEVSDISRLKFVATVQMSPYVWHVFEVNDG